MIVYNGSLVRASNVHNFPEYIRAAYKLEVMHQLYENGEATDIIQEWERLFDADMKRRATVKPFQIQVPEDVRVRLNGRFLFSISH